MTAPLSIPVLPPNAPFTPEQRAWINGFLAGMFSRADGTGHDLGAGGANGSSAPKRGQVVIGFGSQTGSAERLAKSFGRALAADGFAAAARPLNELASPDLARAERLLIVTSTYGDGEMPDNAQQFWEWLSGDHAPRLDGVEFAVLALGDSNYAQFCEAGKRLDRRLEALGARRVVERHDCDVDYETLAQAWFQAATGRWIGAGAATPALAAPAPKPADAGSARGWDKANPYAAALVENRCLNGAGSSKETRHFAIDLGDSGLVYEAGDALGVWPENCPELVREVLEAAGVSGDEPVEMSGRGELSLRAALTGCLDLGKPSPALLALVGASDAADHDVAGLLRAHSRRWNGGELVGALKRLQPRLYSIASSPAAHGRAVHLTVGIVRFEVGGRARKGACSTFLADRAGLGGTVRVFVHAAPHFRLPPDDAPMVMVGPGTGIAPFRGFLHERRARGATGRNWLFFGDQRAATDFLYCDELEGFLAEGVLSRLDTAFSRDQAEKVYVQHRMLEHAEELWRWMEAGAVFFVCGDASRMAKDVDQALHEVAQRGGGLNVQDAAAWVTRLKQEKRIRRDVY